MKFFDWFQSVAETAPPELKDPETGPVKDDWQLEIGPGALDPDEPGNDHIPESIAGICVGFEYLDASGARSSRRIICRSVFEAHEMVFVHGFCLWRGENRMFRADRIQKLRLPPDWVRFPDHLSFFRAYLRPSLQNNRNKWDAFLDGSERYARLSQTRRVASHGLRVLAFMAREDGAMLNQERKIVHDYIREVAKFVEVELSEDDCAEIASDIDKLFPTKRQVVCSLDVIVHDPEQSALLLNALNALMIADGLRSRRQANGLAMLVELFRSLKANLSKAAG